MPSTVNPSLIKLSNNVSVTDYKKLELAQDREALSQFVRDRFTERYLRPLDVEPTKKSGFAMIAVACLMIEALESFSHGWTDTNGRSELAFCSFFSRWNRFEALRPHSSAFYKHIRCAILHQAETTGGWRIWRKGPLLDPMAKTLNAQSFVAMLTMVLDDYVRQLNNSEWTAEIWVSFRKKMASICKNAIDT
jgi:hypothetical protein